MGKALMRRKRRNSIRANCAKVPLENREGLERLREEGGDCKDQEGCRGNRDGMGSWGRRMRFGISVRLRWRGQGMLRLGS